MICCYAMSRFRVVSCASHETPLLIIMKLVALSKWFVTHYTLQRSSKSFNIGDRTTVKLSNKYSNSDHNTKKQHKHFHHTSLFYPPFFNLKNLQAPSKPLTNRWKHHCRHTFKTLDRLSFQTLTLFIPPQITYSVHIPSQIQHQLTSMTYQHHHFTTVEDQPVVQFCSITLQQQQFDFAALKLYNKLIGVMWCWVRLLRIVWASWMFVFIFHVMDEMNSVDASVR